MDLMGSGQWDAQAVGSGTPMQLCVSGQWDAHAIMRFVYRIEIVNALKPIVHIFELPCLPPFFNASTYHVMQCFWSINSCFP